MAMEMDHSFTVPVPPERAWDVLLDVEKIAPCMPGATVDSFDGEVVTGRIKVKVGPVSLTYRGTAKFTERDPDAKVIVLEASGKETRGAGTASATVRATLEPESGGEGTTATLVRDCQGQQSCAWWIACYWLFVCARVKEGREGLLWLLAGFSLRATSRGTWTRQPARVPLPLPPRLCTRYPS
jgi:carbon monoxide dehydrogenase subunit G